MKAIPSIRLAGTGADIAQSFTYNPAGQVKTQSRNNDAYAFTGRYNVNRPYAANGLNQYSAAGAVGFCYDGVIIPDGTGVTSQQTASMPIFMTQKTGLLKSVRSWAALALLARGILAA